MSNKNYVNVDKLLKVTMLQFLIFFNVNRIGLEKIIIKSIHTNTQNVIFGRQSAYLHWTHCICAASVTYQ